MLFVTQKIGLTQTLDSLTIANSVSLKTTAPDFLAASYFARTASAKLPTIPKDITACKKEEDQSILESDMTCIDKTELVASEA